MTVLPVATSLPVVAWVTSYVNVKLDEPIDADAQRTSSSSPKCAGDR